MLASSHGGRAQQLRIVTKAAVDSRDPHIAYNPNRAVLVHVYESLLGQDALLRPRPLLATAWQQADPLTWEFTLRPDVRFGDGTPLSADDVVLSLQRARTRTGPRTYGAALRRVVAVEAVGDRMVRLRTDRPVPDQPARLATIAIMSARGMAEADAPADAPGSTPERRDSRVPVGTGPYQWVRWTRGQEVILARNPTYWGGVEPWARVQFRAVPNDAARVATLLAGDADVAEAIPANDRAAIQRASMQVVSVDSTLVDYLFLDTLSPSTSNVTDARGQVLPTNPLRDLRVRDAMDHAINRAVLAERIMDGGATPAGQFVPPGLDGFVPGLRPTPYDPARARQLLAEAGYPDGFTLSLACSVDRFAGDGAVCQAIAQMLTSAGIRTRPVTMPVTTFLQRWFTSAPDGRPLYTAAMFASGSPSGSVLEWMNTILHSPIASAGRGAGNPGYTADPQLDAAIEAAESAEDPAVRTAAVADAVGIGVRNRSALPLLFLKSSWAVRPGLVLEPRADGATLATGIRAVQP